MSTGDDYFNEPRKLVPGLKDVDSGPVLVKALFMGTCANRYSLYFDLHKKLSKRHDSQLAQDINACVEAIWRYVESGGKNAELIDDMVETSEEMPLHDYDRDEPQPLFLLAQAPSIGLASAISYLRGRPSARAKYVSAVLFDVIDWHVNQAPPGSPKRALAEELMRKERELQQKAIDDSIRLSPSDTKGQNVFRETHLKQSNALVENVARDLKLR